MSWKCTSTPVTQRRVKMLKSPVESHASSACRSFEEPVECLLIAVVVHASREICNEVFPNFRAPNRGEMWSSRAWLLGTTVAPTVEAVARLIRTDRAWRFIQKVLPGTEAAVGRAAQIHLRQLAAPIRTMLRILPGSVNWHRKRESENAHYRA